MAKNRGQINTPQGGIFEGEAGSLYANKQPLDFYNFALANEGRTGFNTAPDAWDYLQNKGFSDIYNQYTSGALAKDENTPFANFLATTYGVGRTPSAANPFATGSVFTPPPPVVDQQFGLGGKKKRRRR